MSNATPARLGLIAALLALAGCGDGRPKLVRAEGTLTHAGRPVVGGSLTFHPVSGTLEKGDRPSCQLRADSSFAAATYPYGEGVVPGQYKVTLSPDLAGRVKRPECADPAKTPLELTVPESGVTDVKLALEK